MRWTIAAIEAANKRAGYHFFDDSTLRFFNSRVLADVYEGPGGVYFVTSERPPEGPREYRVRVFSPDSGRATTAYDGFAPEVYVSARAAKRRARTLAAVGRAAA